MDLNFHSFRIATLILLNVPLAATGGIAALLLRGMPFSVSAGVGFIALFGIAVLNGVVLISYVADLQKQTSDHHHLGIQWEDLWKKRDCTKSRS
jgi:cobalt-zinc-cadmium resistance protein CzcA